jgi:hypothetical protein
VKKILKKSLTNRLFTCQKRYIIKLNRNDLEKKTMNEEGGGRTMKMKKILLVALSLMLLLAFGCSKDTNNSSVTNPNPGTLKATGTVQGIVKDSCTGNPIVGAVVDIGVAKATTNTDGQYTMKNVPATSYIKKTTVDGSITTGTDTTLGSADLAVDSGYSGSYSATIDTSNAYAVNNDGTRVANTNYARVYYSTVSVSFASLEPSTGVVTDTNNKVTPVLLGNGEFDFYLGELTASISGTVQMAANHAVAANYVVALYSTNDSSDSNNATGFDGHLVKSTVTKADGTFSITGLEAGASFKIVAVDTATGTAQYMGTTSSLVTSACDASNYNIGTIYAASTDTICPFILSATPLNWSDVTATVPNGQNITFTFSKPILATQYNTGRALLSTTDFDQFHGLYQDISVNYTGNKVKDAGNLPHTLSWSADMTVLTINIPQASIAPAAVYAVVIENTRYLTDAAGNELSDGPNVKTGVVPCSFDSIDNAINFTTFGAVPAGAITDLEIRDPLTINYNSNPTISWTPIYGAKGYNLYCQLIQWPGELTSPCDQPVVTGQTHPYFLVGYTENSIVSLDFDGRGSLAHPGFADILVKHGYRGVGDLDEADTDFVENGLIKLAYNCYLRGVDADGIEGPASNVVYLEDTVHPTACVSPLLVELHSQSNSASS